jgi:putative oxidoreductase
VVEAYGYDPSQVPFVPWGIVVYAGTYAEFILPVLIVLGLFTRLASLGMIGFILVQSYVDIAFHGVDDKTIGAWFDRFSDAAILDQRTLWIFLLLTLVVKGAGAISLDALWARTFTAKAVATA